MANVNQSNRSSSNFLLGLVGLCIFGTVSRGNCSNQLRVDKIKELGFVKDGKPMDGSKGSFECTVKDVLVSLEPNTEYKVMCVAPWGNKVYIPGNNADGISPAIIGSTAEVFYDFTNKNFNIHLESAAKYNRQSIFPDNWSR